MVGDPALADATVSYWGDGFSLLSVGTLSQCTSPMCSLRTTSYDGGSSSLLHEVSFTDLTVPSDMC